MHQEYTYELISAYVDGEVTSDERRRAEQLLATHDDLRQYREELLRLREELRKLPSHRLPAAFAADVLQEIARRSETANHTSSPSASSRTGPSPAPHFSSTSGSRSGWRWTASLLAMTSAAALLLTLLSLGLLDRIWGGGNTNPQEIRIVNEGGGDLNRAHQGMAHSSGDPSESARIASGRDVPSNWEPEDSNARASGPQRDRGDLASANPAAPEFPPPSESRPVVDPDTTARAEGSTAESPADVSPRDLAARELAAAGRDAFMFMYMVDVVLSARGIDEQIFTQVLERAEIPWMDRIPVDAAMEQSLLDTRYFGKVTDGQLPIEPTPGTGESHENFLQLVYVVARGQQIVDITEQLELAQQTGEVVVFQHELVGGNFSELAGMLNRTMRLGRNSSSDPVRAQTLSVEPTAQQRLLARLHSNAQARDTASPAESVLSNATENTELRPLPAVQSTKVDSAVLAMENQRFLALFFLRSEQRVRDEAGRQ